VRPFPTKAKSSEEGEERALWCPATGDQRGASGALLPRRVRDLLRSSVEGATTSRGDPYHADVCRAAG